MDLARADFMVESYDAYLAALASKKLEQYRRHDFAPAQDLVREKLGKEAAAQMHLRPVAVVARYAAERSRCYTREPSREFKGLGVTASRRLLEIYERMEFTARMKTAAEKAATQLASVVLVDMPRAGRPRLTSYVPYEFYVHRDDLLEDDLRYASRVELRVPVGTDDRGEVFYGWRVYTPTEAYLATPDGAKTGLFFEDPADLRNPLGYIPVYGIRLVEGIKGMWKPVPPSTLLKFQEAMVLDRTDIAYIAQSQCYAERYLKGQGAIEGMEREIQTGPRRYQPLAEDVEIEVINTDPKLDAYSGQLEDYAKDFERYMGLPPGALTESSGITGDAKELELRDSEEAKVEFERVMRQAETAVADILVDVWNADPRNVERLRQPEGVNVRFHYVEARRNDLQTEQAAVLREGRLADSKVEEVMRELGCSEERALEHLRKRKAWRKEFAPAQESDDGPGASDEMVGIDNKTLAYLRDGTG